MIVRPSCVKSLAPFADFTAICAEGVDQGRKGVPDQFFVCLGDFKVVHRLMFFSCDWIVVRLTSGKGSTLPRKGSFE